MGLLAALDTACLLTPRAWATSARERVVSIFPDGRGSDRCQVAGLFLEGSCSGPTGAHLVGNGVGLQASSRAAVAFQPWLLRAVWAASATAAASPTNWRSWRRWSVASATWVAGSRSAPVYGSRS